MAARVCNLVAARAAHAVAGHLELPRPVGRSQLTAASLPLAGENGPAVIRLARR